MPVGPHQAHLALSAPGPAWTGLVTGESCRKYYPAEQPCNAGITGVSIVSTGEHCFVAS